jgi:hypothetical protein
MPAESKARREFFAEVERLGGSVRRSADGHDKVFSRSGRFLLKVRAAGHGVGNTSGTERRIYASVLRKVQD